MQPDSGTFAAAVRSVSVHTAAAMTLSFGCLSGAAHAQTLAWGAEEIVNGICLKCHSVGADMAVHPTTGNALAVWIQDDGVPDIAAARYDAKTGRWRGFKTLFAGGSRDFALGVNLPQVALDGAGNGIAVWAEGATHSIHYARYRASDNTWVPSAVLHTGTEFNHVQPRVAADNYGNIVVQWSEGFFGNRVMVKRYNAANQTWSAAIELAANSTWTQPAIASDRFGNTVVMWINTDLRTVMVSRFSMKFGQWSSPRPIGHASDLAYPQVVMDHSGNATALWRIAYPGTGEFGDRTVAARYSPVTNRWSEHVEIQTASGYVTGTDMAADGKNNVTVIWGQAPSYGVPTVLYAVRFDAASATWSRPQALTNGRQHDLWPKLAADRNGNAAMVWSRVTRIDEFNGERTTKKAARRYDAVSGRWGATSLTGAESIEAFGHDIGFGPNGTALSIFAQDSGFRWNNIFPIAGIRAHKMTLAP